MSHSVLRKIVILGTTGSGKTTFMKNLVEGFDGSKIEQTRNITLEEEQLLNTFTQVAKDMYQNSTTTVSLNASGVLFLTTRTNEFHYFPLYTKKMPIEFDNMDSIYPTVIVDTAGQERFGFMQDIGLKGADAVIIFADGTNVQSLERVSYFYQKIQEEEKRTGKSIPITVFNNKKDLEEKGLYVGSAAISRWVPEVELDVHETSNFDMDTFYIPIRNLLNKIRGFPLTTDQLTRNSAASD